MVREVDDADSSDDISASRSLNDTVNGDDALSGGRVLIHLPLVLAAATTSYPTSIMVKTFWIYSSLK